MHLSKSQVSKALNNISKWAALLSQSDDIVHSFSAYEIKRYVRVIVETEGEENEENEYNTSHINPCFIFVKRM